MAKSSQFCFDVLVWSKKKFRKIFNLAEKNANFFSDSSFQVRLLNCQQNYV